VLLYFLTGLLPDPDGPWTPTISHCHAWVFGALLEAVLAVLFLTEKRSIHLPPHLLKILSTFSLVRILVFTIMIVLVARRQYELKVVEQGSPSERRPLLEDGDTRDARFGSANGTAAGDKANKARDPQKAGWFDYFAGFQVLFPYLW
jgi:ATP-binding cassette, subfamily B, vacuolar membrane transporter HMT1/ACLQ